MSAWPSSFDMSRQRSDCWPDCPERDALFGKALLLHGPVPDKGWAVTRNPDYSVSYVNAKGKAAHRFKKDVTQVMLDDINKRYSHRGWSRNHRHRLALKWKNEFFRWLWRQVDEADSS
jgi:hypothetical protein